jgi:hypothetical protein
VSRQLGAEVQMAKRMLGFACLLLAATARAHPGHGSLPSASWLHGLEAAHLAPLAALLAAILLARGALRRAAAREHRR